MKVETKWNSWKGGHADGLQIPSTTGWTQLTRRANGYLYQKLSRRLRLNSPIALWINWFVSISAQPTGSQIANSWAASLASSARDSPVLNHIRVTYWKYNQCVHTIDSDRPTCADNILFICNIYTYTPLLSRKHVEYVKTNMGRSWHRALCLSHSC